MEILKPENMKKLILPLYLFFSAFGYAQEIKCPMEAAYWEYDPAQVEFVTHRSVKAARGTDGAYYQLHLKDHKFSNGTIEFDVELTGMGFPGIDFRMSDDRKDGEHFYIRSFGDVSPLVRTTVQYAAIIDGTSMWDLTDEYQSGAAIYQEGWNHVKLVISGKQMWAYVNDMKKPALAVPELEGVNKTGGITLNGNVIFANFRIHPDATEGLSPEAGYISTANDTRYIRNWQVNQPVEFPFGKDIVFPLPSANGALQKSELPDSTTQWNPIAAEKRGVVNLNRKFGSLENANRRLVWLKTIIQSDKDQEKILRMGFSDEVWVFINGNVLYVDKNYYGTPSQKEPKGRCTIDNTTLKLPLKEGNNEIMIALANYFYGWGIIARFDKMDGIKLE